MLEFRSWKSVVKFLFLRRRHINITGNSLCVSLRSLRSLRLRNIMMANEVADKDVDLLLVKRKVRKGRKGTQRRWREVVEVDMKLEVRSRSGGILSSAE